MESIVSTFAGLKAYIRLGSSSSMQVPGHERLYSTLNLARKETSSSVFPTDIYMDNMHG